MRPSTLRGTPGEMMRRHLKWMAIAGAEAIMLGVLFVVMAIVILGVWGLVACGPQIHPVPEDLPWPTKDAQGPA